MANLVSAATVKVQVKTALSDDELDVIIARIEEEITALIGAPQTGDVEVTETVSGQKAKNIYLKRPILTVSSVTEYSQLSDTTGYALTEDEEFYVWEGQGRLERIFNLWGKKVTVVYKPTDQRKKRTAVIIDLVRLELQRTALFQEAVGGEYSYTAPANWERERQRILSRLQFTAV